uniref:Uncharacterized protein n=1 Tax=Trichinella nativa TaxID=6335 RepID=A0A0V1KHC4_9BILA
MHCTKALPHWLHSKGFSPGFSPVCVRLCIWRVLLCAKALPHCLHS